MPWYESWRGACGPVGRSQLQTCSQGDTAALIKHQCDDDAHTGVGKCTGSVTRCSGAPAVPPKNTQARETALATYRNTLLAKRSLFVRHTSLTHRATCNRTSVAWLPYAPSGHACHNVPVRRHPRRSPPQPSCTVTNLTRTLTHRKYASAPKSLSVRLLLVRIPWPPLQVCRLHTSRCSLTLGTARVRPTATRSRPDLRSNPPPAGVVNEKNTRGKLKSTVERVVGRKGVTILDSINNIKVGGSRAQ